MAKVAKAPAVPYRPAPIDQLFHALVKVVTTSAYLAGRVAKLVRLADPPELVGTPHSRAARERRKVAALEAIKEKARREGNDPDAEGMITATPWLDAENDLREAYPEWVTAIQKAIEQVPSAAPWTDSPDEPLVRRWTTQLKRELAGLLGTLSPVVVGDDGLGIVRSPQPLPPSFGEMVVKIDGRRQELAAIPATPVPPARRAKAKKPTANGKVGRAAGRSSGHGPASVAQKAPPGARKATPLFDEFPAKRPSKAVSLTYAAEHWFPYEIRKLQSVITGHAIRASQISARLWHFDLDDIAKLNPSALADATPDLRRRPRKRARSRRNKRDRA